MKADWVNSLFSDDAAAFAAHAAREIVFKQHGTAPILVEAAGYFNRAGIMATSEFLPRAKCFTETRALLQSRARIERPPLQVLQNPAEGVPVFHH